MKNKFFLVILCMFLLIGALAPMVSAQDTLQMWRNSSSGVTPQVYPRMIEVWGNVSWVAPLGVPLIVEYWGNNNGNWYMMGDLNITGDLLVNGANTTGDYVFYTLIRGEIN